MFDSPTALSISFNASQHFKTLTHEKCNLSAISLSTLSTIGNLDILTSTAYGNQIYDIGNRLFIYNTAISNNMLTNLNSISALLTGGNATNTISCYGLMSVDQPQQTLDPYGQPGCGCSCIVSAIVSCFGDALSYNKSSSNSHVTTIKNIHPALYFNSIKSFALNTGKFHNNFNTSSIVRKIQISDIIANLMLWKNYLDDIVKLNVCFHIYRQKNTQTMSMEIQTLHNGKIAKGEGIDKAFCVMYFSHDTISIQPLTTKKTLDYVDDKSTINIDTQKLVNKSEFISIVKSFNLTNEYSNGKFSVFSTSNIINNTDSLTIYDIFSMFGLQKGKTIQKKNIIGCIDFIFANWQQNLKTCIFDVYICHMNCHINKIYSQQIEMNLNSNSKVQCFCGCTPDTSTTTSRYYMHDQTTY